MNRKILLLFFFCSPVFLLQAQTQRSAIAAQHASAYSALQWTVTDCSSQASAISHAAEILKQEISRQEAAAGIRIYPNPCSEQLNLDFSHSPWLGESLQVRITDLMGREIHSASVTAGMNQAVWQPGDIQDGIYLLRIYRNGELISSARVVKNN